MPHEHGGHVVTVQIDTGLQDNSRLEEGQHRLHEKGIHGIQQDVYEQDLFGRKTVAIDGTKVKAWNARDKTYISRYSIRTAY